MARRYLSVAFSPEGPSDPDLLMPIVRRTLEELCLLATSEVEIAEPVSLAPRQASGRQSTQATVDAARGHGLLVVHVDGNGDPAKARSVHVAPLRSAFEQTTCRVVGVVPVRESEAWALANGDTLRRVFRVTATDEELGVPRPSRRVAALADPKATLDFAAAIGASRSQGRRGRSRARAHFSQIGELIPLQALRAVPAFEEFEIELSLALLEMAVLPADSS